ncbi:hypothetical protein C0991_004051 [Blastosporella zonata]|nr:hypothetical protein C0991_004051 [Blastosporella zonata]
MAQSFIGKPISLISHSDVRYRGILAGIDPAASTIQLSNDLLPNSFLQFKSRTNTLFFVPPRSRIYPLTNPLRAGACMTILQSSYVFFPTISVLHLITFTKAAPPPNTHTSPYPVPAQQAYPQPVPPPQQQQYQQQPPQQQQQQTTQAQAPRANAVLAQQPQPQPGRRSNSVHTAAASLETVERALGDLRVSNGAATTARGGRRGGAGAGGRGRGDGQQQQIKVPTTDFDFAGSNAKFDKAALTPKAAAPSKQAQDEGEESESEEGEDKEGEDKKEKEKETEDATAYNPSKSFFDSLSSNTQAPAPTNPNGSGGGFRGRRGGRGGVGRNRREEERERNVATFGEPGGVGLLGPGAYVGGWGGYGRRGGGRPRRGGPPGNVQVQQQTQTPP